MSITKEEKVVKYVGDLSLEGEKTRASCCTTKGMWELCLCCKAILPLSTGLTCVSVARLQKIGSTFPFVY